MRSSFRFLGLDVSRTDVRGGETALGKLIDREALFSFLLDVSETVFDLIEWAMDGLGRLRYGDLWEKPLLHRPRSFAIPDAAQLSAELSEARTKKLPKAYQRLLLEELLASRFSLDEKGEARRRLLLYADSLLLEDDDHLLALHHAGLLPAWKLRLHHEAESLMDAGEVEFADFWEWGLERQKAWMETQVKDVVN
jgi:hypothetical protein